MAFQVYDPAKAALQQRRRSLGLSLVILAVLLAAQAFVLRAWIAADTRPPSWDQSVHLEIALDYKEALARGDWSALWHPVPKPGMPAFPPLYHLALQPAMGSAHPAHAALWVNFAYLAALAFCLFGLIFEFRSDVCAALAAAAFVLAPGVQDLLLNALVDLPVIACSTAAYWAFVRSDEFSEWLPSLAFAVLFSIGMLHKWSFFAYMLPAGWVWLHALAKPRSRVQACVTAVVAAVLTAPWYLANWPLLLPRLFQASSDFAVPFWHGTEMLHYFMGSVESLGPALWFIGWLGVFVAQYNRRAFQGWVILAWIASAYVFWTIVPNRQMRFLMPAFPALAAAACGDNTPGVLWVLVALQLAGAVNFYRGWIGPISLHTPLGGITLAPNHPPASQDWAVDRILAEASRRADPASPVANLTLIANAPYFNGPTFTWRARALGLSRVHVRGVNARLCELSQFVVLKKGELGPASVIGGLKKAADLVESPDSWFQRGYEKAAEWPLPDGSAAVLYQRAAPKKAPMPERRLQREQYESGGVTALRFSVDLGAWDPAAGDYPSASLSASEVTLRGLKIEDVRMRFQDLLLVPVEPLSGIAWDDVRLLKLGKLSVVSAKVSADSLKAFLEKRVRGLKLSQVKLDGTVTLAGNFRGFPIGAELAVEPRRDRQVLALRLVSLSLGPNPLPTGAINRIKELTIPLSANPETPFAIDLPGVTIKDGWLSVP